MNSKEKILGLDAIITESGLIELGNLIEEYQLGHNLSENKLIQLNTLLVTYYFNTENFIHTEIFDAINCHFENNKEKHRKTILYNIQTLHENGFLKRKLNYKQIIGERE